MSEEHLKKEKYDLLDIAIGAASQAGLILREHFTLNAGIASDKGRDIKTEADKAADLSILKMLLPTGYPILSEESGNKSLSGLDTRCWIIDPLDGTFNFVRGFPSCSVSIALWQNRNPLLGVIYDFGNDRLYSGVVGEGAFCKGLPLQVSSTNCCSQAALATGFPTSRDFSDNALLKTIRRIQKFKKIRMIGSAALSLAYVSAGIVDAYYEEDIWLWDVAAGLALVRAAGGDFTISEIKSTWQLDVYASNGIISF